MRARTAARTTLTSISLLMLLAACGGSSDDGLTFPTTWRDAQEALGISSDSPSNTPPSNDPAPATDDTDDDNTPDDDANDDDAPVDDEPTTDTPPLADDGLGCYVASDYGTIAKVSPTTGGVWPTFTVELPPNAMMQHALTLWGGSLVGCLYTEQGDKLFDVPLDGGEMVVRDLGCRTVTSWRGGLLLMPTAPDHGEPLRFYAGGLADIDAGIAPEELDVPYYASRLFATDDKLYFAWHSTNVIDVYDVEQGVSSEIVLEGYDTWVQGLHVTDEGDLFLNAVNSENRIARFNAETGAAVADALIEGRWQGLACP